MKTYSVRGDATCNRRFAAYHALLSDACQALGKPTIHAAFSVVFDGRPTLVNNVGMLVVPFEETTTGAELVSRFTAAQPLALASNAMSVTGATKLTCQDGVTFRQRLDVVCTSMVVDEDALESKIGVQPMTQVFEQAYVSLFSRLVCDNGASVTAAVTTNADCSGWVAAGFVRRP